MGGAFGDGAKRAYDTQVMNDDNNDDDDVQIYSYEHLNNLNLYILPKAVMSFTSVLCSITALWEAAPTPTTSSME
jgi:hypothetical protein